MRGTSRKEGTEQIPSARYGSTDIDATNTFGGTDDTISTNNTNSPDDTKNTILTHISHLPELHWFSRLSSIA